MKRLLLLALSVITVDAQDVRRLTILHSNDLHARFAPDSNQKGGFAYLATLVRQERAGCRHCLYLNAGDLVQGTPVSTIFKGTPVYEVGNKLKFDASTIGNHEFDYGYAQVPLFLKTARFPIVSANVVNAQGRLMASKPYLIRKVNGIRLAIIGAVMGNLVEGFLKPKDAGEWKALPVTPTVARYARELRDRVDIIIVLGHILKTEGSDILRNVPEVSVVVQGHNHAGYELEQVENRISVGCEGYGVNLCRLDLEVNVPQKKLVSWNWKKLPVDAKTVTPARDVQKLVEHWEKKVAEKVDVRIGEARKTFERADLKPLIEQAIRDELHADFSFMNTGGVRDRLPKGEILARHVWNIMPFDNQMMVAKVRGSEVSNVLRMGRSVEADREYTIALPDFVATNEVNSAQLGVKGVRFEDADISLRDVILNWITKRKVLE